VAPEIALAELYKQKQRKPDARAALEKAVPNVKNPKEKKQLLRALADLALDAGDVDGALKQYQQLIDLDPNDASTHLDLADALAKYGHHDKALEEYRLAEKRLATDPARRVEVMAREGAELEALSKSKEAVEIYRKAMAETQRGNFQRKVMIERIIDIYRKSQELRDLLASNEKEWPVATRGHFEWDVLARLYEEVGEQDKALDAYRHAVAAAPGELDTQKRLLALLERSGRDEELLKQYEALIRVAPGEPRFQLELAERIWKKGEKRKALVMAASIAAHFPDDAGVHSALAELYARWGEDALAVKEYETLVKIEPSDDTHLVNLGEQYYQRGDKAKALDTWKRIANAKTPEAYARLAEVYAEHDLGNDAIDMYQRALALKPRDPGLWKGLAGVHERQRQDDRALDAWERVMDVTNGDAAQKLLRREARTRIVAILFRKSGQPLLAKTREWVHRFEASPPDMEAGYRLVEAYLKLNRLDDAQRILARILEIDGKDLDAKQQLVTVYKSQRKLAEAIELLKQLAVDQPALERQYDAEIAELELALYHDEEAIAYAQKALEKSPNDAVAQERLAEIYSKKEDFAKAIEAYKRAIALAPRAYKVYFALAKLYLRDGKYEAAASLFRDVVKHAPDEETVRAAAHKAIDLQEYMGTLGELEEELAPLAFLPTNRATYRRMIVEIYDRYVPPLVARAHAGDPAAAKELARLGEHGLKPLLEALDDASDPAQQRVAVRVLGYLGNKSAAAPLVKIALEAANPSTTGVPAGSTPPATWTCASRRWSPPGGSATCA
jgi:tetratricopeptide (TPR) repeat protein